MLVKFINTQNKSQIDQSDFALANVTYPEVIAYLAESFFLPWTHVSSTEGTHTCDHKREFKYGR